MTATKKTGTRQRTAAKKPAAKTSAAKKAAVALLDPVRAKGSPTKFRVRVRMYRQGLGDCFLVTFGRDSGVPFQMLIDCGVLTGTKVFMTKIVEHIRETIRADAGGGTGKVR